MPRIFYNIFSFSLKLLNSQFPLFVVPLLLFLFLRRREIIVSLRKNPSSRFLLSYFFVVFSIRFLLYMVGYPYQGRYFHPLVLISIFPASAGLIIIAEYLKRFKIKNTLAWLSLLVVIICTIKVLNPPSKKDWLKTIPDTIKANHTGNGRRIVLISSFEDGRLPYYSSQADFHLIKPLMVDFFLDANIQSVDKNLGIIAELKQSGQFLINLNGTRSQIHLLITREVPRKFKSLSFSWAKSPKDVSINVKFKKDLASDFESIESVRSDKEQIVFKEEILAKQFLITMNFNASIEWHLIQISGHSFDSYQVFSEKYYQGNMKWLPENFDYGFQSLFQAAEAWGGKNVFILFDSPKKEIEDAWTARGLSSNLKFIGEFKTHKKQSASLYQGGY